MDNLTNVTNATPNTQQNVQSQPTQTQVVNQGYLTQPIQSAPNNQALFTQEQLNSIIQGRVNPLNQRVQDLTSQLTQAQQLSQSYLNELQGYKNKEIVANAGIPAYMQEFVAFEAQKLAVNGKSFADAVKEYTQANAQLFNIGQSIQNTQPTPQTIPSAGQVSSQTAMQNTSVAQNQQVIPNQPSVVAQVQGVVQNPSVAVQSTVQTGQVAQGATSFTGVVNPNGVNDVDSAVDTFLRNKGIRK
jgi:hypothetical protein|nr:MAG TPA: hypothetical protein [Caudoviricetes sp.]